jgi:hypothetical protein
MSSSIAPASTCFARGSLLGGMVDWSGLPRIYMVVHSVGPPVVIALHSKDVTVLSEELFQLLGFRVSQVCHGCCNPDYADSFR